MSGKGFYSILFSVLFGIIAIVSCDSMRHEEPLTICFIRDGNVYTIDTDGKNLQQLTFTGNDSWPSWSSDGKLIVFQRLIDSTNEIFLMNSDGSGIRQITVSAGDVDNYCPSWIPGTRKIVYNKFVPSLPQSYITIVDTEGVVINDFLLSGVTVSLEVLTVSNDGTMVAYIYGPGEIGLFNIPGNSNNPSYISPPMIAVSWFPENKILIYRPGTNNNVWQYIVGPNTQSTLLSEIPFDSAFVGLSCSPAGDALVIASNQPDVEGIYVHSFSNNELKRITNGTNDKQPCFMGKPR